MSANLPTKKELLAAHRIVQSHVHRTPVLTSRTLDSEIGAQLYLKCENFQRMGAFKMRGAVNAIMKIPEEKRARGVVTHSSGNFGQAVALAAKELGVPAYIVMPANAPKVKKEAVRGYGAQITECEPTLAAREETAATLVQQNGATALHPSNSISVILGNATAAMELLDAHPKLEILVTPVGGGGLLAGTALAAHHFGTACTVLGAEPKNVDDAYRSLRSGVIETNASTQTVADGLRTHLGDKNFPIIKELVPDIIRVTEEEIVSAMHFVWERMKIVIEPSSAVAVAAVRKEPERFKNKAVGIIISGGNVSLDALPFS